MNASARASHFPSITVTGSGPAVVALHCSLGSRHQWRPLAAQLDGGMRLIALDLAGYGARAGESVGPGHTLEAECARVRATLREVLAEDEPYHLVGHSFGGACALRMAWQDRSRVLSLAMFEPTAFHLLPPSSTASVIRELGVLVREALAQGAHAEAAEIFVDFWNGPGAFRRLPADRQAPIAGQMDKVRHEFDALLGETVAPANYGALDMPVLLMRGNDTRACTRTIVHLLAAALPRATVRATAGGHMAPVTHAEQVAAVLADFLQTAGMPVMPAAIAVPAVVAA